VTQRPRQVIDYALARRALLADLFSGRASTVDVCDAHPYLLRAAKYHGESTQTPCPVCRGGVAREPLTHVTYVYGDALKDTSGRPRSVREIATLARQHPDLHVYVVEVCRNCSWNHLVTSYVVGKGASRARRPASSRSAAQR
jgi:hypothetical protein